MYSDPPLAPEFQSWLTEVTWIISDYEKNAFLELKTDEERRSFIEAFWENRDPTPGTKENEFESEHHKRFEYSNHHFGRESAVPGWKTDRGRIYILLGPPQFIKRFPESMELYPLELWQYSGEMGYGLPTSFYVLFFQKMGVGPYRIYSPLQDGIRALRKEFSSSSNKSDEQLIRELGRTIDPDLAQAAVSSIPTEGGGSGFNLGSLNADLLRSSIDNAPNYEVEKRSYVSSFLSDRPQVKVYSSLGSEGTRSAVFWFLGPDQNFYLDFVAEYDPAKFDMGHYSDYYTSLDLDTTVTTRDHVLVDRFEQSSEVKLEPKQFAQVKDLPFQYHYRRIIIPGRFDFAAVLANNVSKTSVTFTHSVTIPDLDKLNSPVVSPILPILSVEEVQRDDNRIRPFEFEKQLYIPNLSGRTRKSLLVYHQVLFPRFYVPILESLSLHYVVMKDGKRELESTQALDVNPDEVAGKAVGIRKELDLEALAPGNKSLVVQLWQGDKVICTSPDLTFTVSADSPPGIWKFSLAESGTPAMIMAHQLARTGSYVAAKNLLDQSIQADPDSFPLRIGYMQIAFEQRDFATVVAVGKAVEMDHPRDPELLKLIAWSNYSLRNLEQSILFFERLRVEDDKNVEVLNALADCYYRLRLDAQALDKINESLRLKPDQPRLAELKQHIENTAH